MTRKAWQLWEDSIMRDRYPHEPTAVVASALGRSDRATYERAAKLGIKKSAAYMESGVAGRLDGIRGGKTRFKKGAQPWNKGASYMPGGRCKDGWFAPGERRGVALKLWRPVGSERISKDGYLERKVNDGLPLQKRWRAVHLIEWEAVNGPLPKGHAIVFRNGDRTDRRPENLECVTRKQLMLRNSYHRYPQPIPKLIQLRGALNRQVNKRAGREKRNRGSAQPPVRGT